MKFYLLKKKLNEKIKKFLFFLRFGWMLEDDLTSFFYRALNRQLSYANKGWSSSSRNYYEFGVGWGGTLTKYIRALNTFCALSKKSLYSHHIFCFDSFEGLPVKKSPKDDFMEWHKGLYACSISEIKQKIIEQGIDLERETVHFIKGYYDKTLTPTLRDELSAFPPSIINIDCDYYSSAKTVLEWLRPMLSSGTFFYFDDIWSFYGHPEYGVLAAIEEFNKEGEGRLTPFPRMGLNGHVFLYSRKEFEFTEKTREIE